MQADPDYLSRHYASLSDEALLEIAPEDLTEAGRKRLEAEIQHRGLRVGVASKRTRPVESDATPDAPDTSELADWLDEAAEVFSVDEVPGSNAAVDAATARDVLDAAGIPCELECGEIPPSNPAPPVVRGRWRLLVPTQFAMHAASTLERDIFNDEFEAQWSTYLAGLDDAELVSATPERVFCGLFDRIERAHRVYEEELERRGKLA